MKRLLNFLLVATMVLGLLTGCGSAENTETTGPAAETTEATVPATNAPTTLKSLKILAIGNSFSVDAMQHLYTIAKAEGVEEIVLGNLYIGGCPLAKHATNAQTGAPAYKYYKNTTGTWETTPETTLLQGLQDEDWDLITMQQSSANSGSPDSFEPYLSELITFVNENKTNPDAKLYWHMTWAYQSDSTHESFPRYGNDQTTMYNAIVLAMQQKVETSGAFAGILPVGTAVQNMRSSYIGDVLTRDGFHLSDLGRAIASYTWYAVLNGQPLYAINVDKIGSVKLDDNLKKAMLESINHAIENPYEVTPSVYK